MKPLRVVLFALVLALPAAPARAAFIGMLGGDFDPLGINNPSVFAMGACNNESGPSIGDESFDSFRCVFYDFADLDGNESLDPVSSIDLNLFGFGPNELFSAAEAGDLHTLGESPFGAFRLSGPAIVPCFFECSGGIVTGLALFVGPSGSTPLPALFAQVVGVNGVSTVPEPATLLLMATGCATLFARRRWGKRDVSSLT